MYKKNILITLLTLICLSLFVSACGNEEPEEKDDSAKNDENEITLEWMVKETQPVIIDFIENEIIAGYTEKNPNVNIKLITNQDAININRQQLAAGAGTDIISVDGPVTLKLFARSGYLLSLEDYKGKYDWESRFADWSYQTGLYNDELYGLPKKLEALMVWYNKDLFKENGWEEPTSLDELLSLNKSIQEKGLIPFAFGTSDKKAANEWWLSVVYNAYLGTDYFEGILEGSKPWTDSKIKEATQIWVDMWEQGYVSDKQSQAISYDESKDLFETQQAVMMMEGTWALAHLENVERSFEYGYFVMPSWDEDLETNLPLALGESIGINVNTEHPEEAVDFLDWINSIEIAEGYAKLGQTTPLNEIDMDGIEGMNPRMKEVFAEINEYSSNGKTGYASWTYWPPKVRHYLWDNIEAVFTDQMTIDEYLDNAQEAMLEDEADGMLPEF